MDSFSVQIREREDPSQDYQRPELSRKGIEEIEAEVAVLAEKEGSSGDDSSSYDSDSDEVEDDDAVLLTPAVDYQIIRTIAAIQAKDPHVYDNTEFFEDPDTQNTKKGSKKLTEKQMKLNKLQILLEDDDFLNEYEEETTGITQRQEQEELYNDFRRIDDDEEEEEDDFLVKKDKSTEEKEAEESDYKKLLLEHMKDDEPSKKAFEAWANYKENPDVNPEDAFLMDYVLNRGWVDKKTENLVLEDDELEKDEELLDDIDRFESKYNFRFEEEGSSPIKTYVHDTGGTAPKKQSKRSKKRESYKLHKAALKEKQMEQIKQQKSQDRKEVVKKLKEINKIAGVENIDFDADYDPAMFDAQMNSVFNDGYYRSSEAVQGKENFKPTWDNDDFMDADYLPGGKKFQERVEEKVKEKVNADTPHVSEEELIAAKRKYDDLMEEYYALNYEDVIGGDIFTRFKYTKTEPENYGLTPEEILLADDAELNKYVGIKALAPYRSPQKIEHEDKIFWEKIKSKKKGLRKRSKESLEAVDQRKEKNG